MRGTFGGRSKVFTRTAPTRQSPVRAPAAVTCVTESFDGLTAFALGPDLNWDEYAYTDGGPVTATSHVHDDVCSLYLDAGDTAANAHLTGRASSSLGSDVEITMDIVSTPVVPFPAVNAEAAFLGISLLARVPDGDLSGDMPSPPAFYANVNTATFLSNGGPTWNYEVGWRTAFYSASFPSGINTFEGNPTSIGFTITGLVGSTLVMEMSVDGVPIATVTHADIIADGYTDYADDPAYTPSGTRCGFQLGGGVEFSGGGQFSDVNDELTVDNWRACPV